MDRRDLALEAALTSMSLRERCSEPGVLWTREPTSLPARQGGYRSKLSFLNQCSVEMQQCSGFY